MTDKEWNSGLFWEHVGMLTKQGHTVVVFEYQAPKDFVCIEKFQTKTDLNTKEGKEARTERLFVHEDLEEVFVNIGGPEQTSLL